MDYVEHMHEVHLERLDLNLLVALRALLAERHVTRAAARVGLTQPAMSHALARLRAALDDPLLVRTRSGMTLTARAAELAEPLERALADLSRLLAPPGAFEPARSSRTFRVATSDYVELVLMPAVLARVWREAPNVVVKLRTLGRHGIEELDAGQVDVALGPLAALERVSVLAQRVLRERFVCVVRGDHPAVGRRLSLDRFLSLPHALITPRGESGGIVDTALARLGARRRIAVEVPHFLVAPFLVEKTDVVLTLAERVARALAPSVRLRILSPPRELDLPGFDVSLVWHERDRADPAHAWFRGLIADVARTL
ncbi:MAG: LysR family transcriptional regulator [Labilithrix sp.]|nr:LysR family transcriptional regulator [Labilithrix sp.]